MSNIIYITAGEKLRKNGEQLVVLREEENFSLHLGDVTAIILESQQCSITVDAHLLCSQSGVPIIICNHKHQPEVFCYSKYSYYQLTKRIKEQVLWENKKIRVKIIAKIIKQKISHQYQLLQYLEKIENKDSYYKSYCDVLEETEDFQTVDTAESICARMYFKQLFGKDFKRQEDDVINAGLNYGYMLMRAIIMNQIVVKGLHPSLGVWHHSQFNNYNLADDVIEVFRPMVDYIVFEALRNSEEFTKEHRILLQQVLLQRFSYNDMDIALNQVISYYLDAILLAFETENVEQCLIPELDVNMYEYQK